MALDQWVESYPRHEDAEAAVDRLASRRFPVEHLAIVGRNVALVERVTGRMGFARYAMIGGVLGFFVGTLLGTLFAPSLFTVPGMIVGALIGAVLGAGERALHYGHDFSAELRHGAGRYALMTDRSELAKEARRILVETGHR